MQTAEELTMTGLSLVFLLLGVVLIASIVLSAFNPYEQIALANTRKLAAVMNQACLADGQRISIDFDLPQNVPIGSNFLTVLPKWLMRIYGDPNFVVYYEAFPPGEAIGWETYHEFDHRLYIRLPDTNPNGDRWTESGVDEYVNGNKDRGIQGKLAEFRQNNPDKTLEGYVVANLVLSGKYPGLEALKIDTKNYRPQDVIGKESLFGGGGTSNQFGTAEIFFGFGSWDSSKSDPQQQPLPVDQEDYFRFKNYGGLPTVEKTLIKYESCGPYALCLKTRGGVYRFPLNNCKNSDIKTVQLVYDARNSRTYDAYIGNIPTTAFKLLGAGIGWIIPVPLGAGKLTSITLLTSAANDVVTSLLGSLYSIKTGDFAIASPCSIGKAEIVQTSCNKTDIQLQVDYNPCERYIKYPIFSIDKDSNIANVGNHYICANYLKTPEGSAIDIPPAEQFKDGDKCVQVKISEPPKGFCWTADTSNFANTIEGFALKSFFPVKNSIEYIKTTGDIALKPTKSEDLDNVVAQTARFFSWGWPFERVTK